MALVTGSLLFLGSLFVAAPIIVHLATRQRPRHIEFPALRFVQQSRAQNQRRLQLRQWLLLLLRCAVVLALAAALARPSVPTNALGQWGAFALFFSATVLLTLVFAVALTHADQRLAAMVAGALAIVTLLGAGYYLWRSLQTGEGRIIGDEEAPIAAVLLFDTSPRMQYVRENQTRLEAGGETGLWLLEQLPRGSQAAIADAHPGSIVFSPDLSTARAAIQRLRITNTPRPLAEKLQAAIRLLAASENERRELYVFTDLSRQAWRVAHEADLRQTLAEHEEIVLNLFDVGVERPNNVALGELKLSGETLTPGGRLQVETSVAASEKGGSRVLELYLEEPDPQLPLIRDGRLELPTPVLRMRQTTQPTPGGAVRVRFPDLPKLPLGVHHGYVRLVGEDGLKIDDARYFSVRVRAPWKVLVCAPPNTATGLFTEAVSPYAFRAGGRSRFEISEIPQAELGRHDLTKYAAVCLLDPAPLNAAVWRRLARFVRHGGGLGVFLGRRASPAAAFSVPAAQELLPGVLQRQWRAGSRELYLTPNSLNHRILQPFRQIASSTPWDRLPVLKHWVFEQLAPQATVVMRYSNGHPAILETSLGGGRVLTMTTPISDAANAPQPPWNYLPTSDGSWPYVVLINEITLYLVGSGDERLNYMAGEVAELNYADSGTAQRFELFTPDGDRQEIVGTRDRVSVRATDLVGAYRLKGHAGLPISLGFSVNLPTSASDLTRIDSARLDVLLGQSRYEMSNSRGEFTRAIGVARQGREFFPHLLLLLALLIVLERVLANRFYRR